MKRVLLGFGAAFLAMTLASAAQPQGRGPHAWCDKDKDGKCDMTGKAVGQRKNQDGAMAGKRQRGHGHRGCCHHGQAAAANPAPEAKK